MVVFAIGGNPVAFANGGNPVVIAMNLAIAFATGDISNWRESCGACYW